MGLGLHVAGNLSNQRQRLLELWRVSEATRGHFEEGFDPQLEAGQPLHRHDEQRPQIQSCVGGLVARLVGWWVVGWSVGGFVDRSIGWLVGWVGGW